MRKNKRMVAAVDKRLEPWVQTSAMVAAPTLPDKKPKVKEGADEDLQISIRSREEFWKALRQRQQDQAAAYEAAGGKEKTIAIPRPEILPVAQPETASPVEEAVGKKYLVWKNKQGTLGFTFNLPCRAQMPIANLICFITPEISQKSTKSKRSIEFFPRRLPTPAGSFPDPMGHGKRPLTGVVLISSMHPER